MTTTENWKPIAGFERLYEVSDLGNVRSVDVLVPYTHGKTGVRMQRLKRGRPKATQPINSGYQIVHLYDKGVRSALLVHRLVAQAFLPNPDGHPEVNHRSGIKSDNAAANLEWISRGGNKDHAVDLGLNVQAVVVRSVKGEEFPSISRAARETGLCPKAIARDFKRV